MIISFYVLCTFVTSLEKQIRPIRSENGAAVGIRVFAEFSMCLYFRDFIINFHSFRLLNHYLG